MEDSPPLNKPAAAKKSLKVRLAASAALFASFTYVTVFHYGQVRGLELTNLLFYMDIWPAFVASAGYATAHLAENFLNLNIKNRYITVVGLVLSGLVVGYWHLPVNSFFGYGVCPADLNDPILYQLKRISYFGIGVVLFFAAKGLSLPWREALAIAFGKVMGWYGFYLTLVQTPIYVAPPVIFSLQLHHEAGFAMLLSMIALDFVAVASLVNHFFKGKTTTPYPLLSEQR